MEGDLPKTTVVLAAALLLASLAPTAVVAGGGASPSEAGDAGRGVLGVENQRSIAVHHNGTVREDIRVPVVLDTGREIQQGDLQPDCSDLRFTASPPEQSRSLTFWLDSEACGDADTTFWVQLPRLSANEPGPEAELIMLYGEPEAEAVTGERSPKNRSTAPAVHVGEETSLVGSSDADGDRISDTLEGTLCDRWVERHLVEDTGNPSGTCKTEGEYAPPARPVRLWSPSLAQAGPDRDGDGAPATVTVDVTAVRVDVTASDPTDVAYEGQRTVTFDRDDGNPSVPEASTSCARLEMSSGTTSLTVSPDEDGDGVPGKIQLSITEVCFDLREDDPEPIVRPVQATEIADLDPDDTDSSVPGGATVSTNPTPTWAAFRGDRDRDHVPCEGSVRFVEVILDREADAYHTAPNTDHTPYDPDCGDPEEPAVRPHGDADGDAIPQLAEPHLCDRQLDTTDVDGTCSELDTNYHPVRGYCRAIGEPSCDRPSLIPLGR